jgi:predicted component of type VI protein secretion system
MRMFVMLLVMTLTLSLCAGTAMAGSPFKEMVLKVLGHTSKTVEKEVNTVGKGVKKTADIVVEEVKDTGKLVTGDGSKVKDVLVKPVQGAAEVTGETAYGVINAPIEAGKKDSEEK